MKCPFIRLFVPQDTDEYDYYLTVISIWPLCLFISFMVLIFEVLCISEGLFLYVCSICFICVCVSEESGGSLTAEALEINTL